MTIQGHPSGASRLADMQNSRYALTFSWPAAENKISSWLADVFCLPAGQFLACTIVPTSPVFASWQLLKMIQLAHETNGAASWQNEEKLHIGYPPAS